MHPAYSFVAPFVSLVFLSSNPAAQCEVFGATVPGAPTSSGVGSSVSIWGDTLIAGAPGASGGRAYVFERVAGEWMPTQTLSASDGSLGDGFGFRVSVFGDLAVIGAPFNDVNGGDSGAAYVFERIGGSWAEVERVVSSDNSFGDYFGIGVATDGEKVVVGGCQFLKFLQVGSGNGAAYVFERSGPNWVETQKVEAFDGNPGDRFGVSVDIDGARLVCGAEDDDDFGASSGTAYVFFDLGANWLLEGKLAPDDSSEGDFFGFDVAIEGLRVVVGAIRADGAAAGSGSAYVFEPDGGSWVQTIELVGPGGATGDDFGWVVDMAGGWIVVGAPGVGGSGAGYRIDGASGLWETEVLEATGAVGGAAIGNGAATDGAGLALGAPDWGTGAAHVWSIDGAACPLLFAWPNSLEAASGGSHGLALRAPAQAGDLYVLIGSSSGTSPGLPLGGGFLLPLNIDAYMTLTLTSSPVVGGVGLLDPLGAADASLPVPPNLALEGLELHHAFVTTDPVTFDLHAISNADELELE